MNFSLYFLCVVFSGTIMSFQDVVHCTCLCAGLVDCRKTVAEMLLFTSTKAALILNTNNVSWWSSQGWPSQQKSRVICWQLNLRLKSPNVTKPDCPIHSLNYATAISTPAVTSNSLLASENNRGLFSFSPLYCIHKQRQHSLEDVATIRSSCCCSADPVDMPSTWLISADTDERAHVSRAIPSQHDAARGPSVSACSLIPGRTHSPPHHLLQQLLRGWHVFCGDLSCPRGHSESHSCFCHRHRGRGASDSMSYH